MQQNDRYIRQLILPGFGKEAQDKLQKAKVLVVGIGGLGCPALQYLVGAGVGNIGIIDADTISLSNLHRQLLFTDIEVGQRKATVAEWKMKELNEHVIIESYPINLVKENALDLISKYDLVIDGTDNFSAKYLINDACVLLNKPWIYGAVSGYEGQVSVFNVTDIENPAIHYRDLFPIPPLPGEIKTCEETGVLGVLPGIIGTMQATEAIKLITGIGKPCYGRLLNYRLLDAQFFDIELTKRSDIATITKSFFDSMNDNGNLCETTKEIEEINVFTFNELRKDPNVFVLDVRERHEYPQIGFSDAQIPMSELQESINNLPEKEICIICHQGIRSLYAASLIKAKRNLKVVSLKGGLTAYFKSLPV